MRNIKDFLFESNLRKDLIAEDYNEISEGMINESFKGSLPSFIAAFISQNKLSEDEIEEIQSLIDSYKGKEK